MLIVAFTCAHLDDVSAPPTEAYLTARRFCKDTHPDIIVNLGDFLDFPYLAKWSKHQPLLAEGKRYKEDIDMATEELERWRCYCGEMHYLEGNHEYRIKRLIEKHPFLQGAMDLETDLQLYDMGINFIPFNKILTIGRLNFIHGWYYGKYHSQKHLMHMGDNIIYGHTHDHQTTIRITRAHQRPHIAKSLGCLCDLNPPWKRDFPTVDWINGIGIIDVDDDTGFFNASFAPIIDGKMIYGGFVWDKNGSKSIRRAA